MKSSTLKTLGALTSILGVLVTVASNWVSEQNTERLIEEKVAEAIEEKSKEN